MEFDFENFGKIEEELEASFRLLADTQKQIHKQLELYADGKVLKGNELVGWLGEIYTKIVVGGYLVDDSFEHDVETSDGLRISVKTRKGVGSGWRRTSAIPKIEGDDCPTHLMFVHLSDSYSVSSMWLYPWCELVKQGRFKRHIVRGNFRSYYMSVRPTDDTVHKIY